MSCQTIEMPNASGIQAMQMAQVQLDRYCLVAFGSIRILLRNGGIVAVLIRGHEAMARLLDELMAPSSGAARLTYAKELQLFEGLEDTARVEEVLVRAVHALDGTKEGPPTAGSQEPVTQRSP
jgi:hypothetical protein